MSSLLERCGQHFATIVCGALLVATPFVTARASTNTSARLDLSCLCNDTYCQASGGGSGFRWCCNGTEIDGCGCTIFTNC
jgi:hypothetical protein